MILSAPVSVKLEPDGTLDLDGAAKPVWSGGGAWGPSGPGAGRAVCTAGLVSNLKQLAYPEGGLGAVGSQRRAPPCSKEPPVCPAVWPHMWGPVEQPGCLLGLRGR